MRQNKDNIDLRKLGEKIHSLRMDKNLSQEELADMCGFDRTYISLVERGKRNMSFMNLCIFARGLDVSVSELTKDI